MRRMSACRNSWRGERDAMRDEHGNRELSFAWFKTFAGSRHWQVAEGKRPGTNCLGATLRKRLMRGRSPEQYSFPRIFVGIDQLGTGRNVFSRSPSSIGKGKTMVDAFSLAITLSVLR